MRRLPAPSVLVNAVRNFLRAAEGFIEGRHKLLVATLATLLHTGFYFLPNRFPLFESIRLPLTWVDLAIPFIPFTAWLYFTDYLLVFVAFSLPAATGHTLRFARVFFFTVVLSTAIHLILPVEYPRELFPVPGNTQALTTTVLQLLRSIDGARSCLPSLHVALATIAALSVRRPSRWSLPVKAWAVVVTVSTMTIKQHYFYDVVAGAIVGALAHALFTPRQATLWLVSLTGHHKLKPDAVHAQGLSERASKP